MCYIELFCVMVCSYNCNDMPGYGRALEGGTPDWFPGMESTAFMILSSCEETLVDFYLNIQSSELAFRHFVTHDDFANTLAIL